MTGELSRMLNDLTEVLGGDKPVTTERTHAEPVAA